MATFESLGVQVERSFHSSSTSVGAGGLNVDLSSSQTTRFVLTLPKPSKLRAAFRKESWGDAIVKVFKKELQTGDKEFDDLVYITTDTPETTAAFLESTDNRNAIALSIETGGAIEIEADRVVAHSVGHESGDDQTLVKIIEALLKD
jgi:hypothetical protein